MYEINIFIFKAPLSFDEYRERTRMNNTKPFQLIYKMPKTKNLFAG